MLVNGLALCLKISFGIGCISPSTKTPVGSLYSRPHIWTTPCIHLCKHLSMNSDIKAGVKISYVTIFNTYGAHFMLFEMSTPLKLNTY